MKRLTTDTAGYLLILAGIAFGWLPGPGGIPLILAGLGLLSVHNEWARRLRNYLIKHGGTLLDKLFPEVKFVQIVYDIICLLLILLVGVFIWGERPMWQISLAVICFFLALLIAGMNRDRLARLRRK